MSILDNERPLMFRMLKRLSNIMKAVILRNIRTRFFGNGLGYLVALGWPLVHILVIIFIFYLAGRSAPYGDSAILYVATGAIPFMVFSYLSRFMMLYSIGMKPLLSFPEVKLLDVLFASAILEILSSFFVVLILLLLALLLDFNFWPRDLIDACLGLTSAIVLGLGFGLFNGVIAFGAPMWATIYALVIVLLWITSGVFFVGGALPEPLRTIASYHPTLQVVEWVRTAYYDGYSDKFLDRGYVIKFGVVMFFGGLLFERLTRGYLLSKK